MKGVREREREVAVGGRVRRVELYASAMISQVALSHAAGE